jgi:hypothetical protein
MLKRGQVAIYVIIAVVIVVLGILIYFLFPQIGEIFGAEFTPSVFLKTCIEPTVQEGVVLLSKQGGYSSPKGFVNYRGSRVKYLCYTSEYFVPCKVQQPLIKAHFEKELEEMIKTKAESCMAELKEEYRTRNYQVSGGDNIVSSVELIPGAINIRVDAPLTVSKESTQTFRTFNSVFNSEIYDLILISTSIIDYEATYGDSAVDVYHQYYPNLRIEKVKLQDGTTVYTLTNVVSGDSFTFASRSLAWPPGYGRETI